MWSASWGFCRFGLKPWVHIVPYDQSRGKIMRFNNIATIGSAVLISFRALGQPAALDSSFAPTNGANGTVRCAAIQPDGKAIVGGSFSTFGGYVRGCLVRLATSSQNRYILEFEEKLDGGNWFSLPAEAGNGDVQILKDTSPNSEQRVYRIRAE
jgi:hypothetical protein